VERFWTRQYDAGVPADLGVGPDSRGALWMPNLPQMVIAFFATLWLGAHVVNTNPLYGGERQGPACPASPCLS
jgi:acyl-CoA synthetase (AMP-forming)/AMP-acid ligase II